MHDTDPMPTRTPPSSNEAEVCVLGSMILDDTVIPSVQEIIDAAGFYRPANQIIFDAIIATSNRGDPVDLVSVKAELEARKELEWVGGIEYVADIVQGVPSAANARYYAKQVRDKHLKRQIITAAGEVTAAAFRDAGPAVEVLAEWQMAAYALEGASDARGVKDVREVTASVIRSATQRDQGLSIGIPDFDFATGGLRPGNYAILAARPGRGKTTLACQVATWLCQRGKAVLYVSREMSENELTARLCCNVGRVDGLQVRRGRANLDEALRLEQSKVTIDSWKLRIDTASRTVPAIASQIRRMRHEIAQPALVVVDYFQLLTGPGRSRYEMFSEISTGLKQMFLSHGVPGLVLAQFRRPVAGQKEQKPKKTDLKETGALEQDADQILLLHLPGSHVDPVAMNTLWGSLDKNRHGPEIGWPDEVDARFRRIILSWEPRYLAMAPESMG